MHLFELIFLYFTLMVLCGWGAKLKHSRLIDQYFYAFDTTQFDELYDLMTLDFYFRNPKVEIHGRDNYIGYAKDLKVTYSTETVNLYAVNEEEYIHKYNLIFFNSTDRLLDRLFVEAKIFIKNGLIASSIINYDAKTLSMLTQDLINMSTQKHGTALTG